MQTDPPAPTVLRRVLPLMGFLTVVLLAYALRGIILPLFVAFMIAYALDPFVDQLARFKVPRVVATILVFVCITGIFALAVACATPLLLEELRAAGADFPAQLQNLEARIEPWLWALFKIKIPHTMGEFTRELGGRLRESMPLMINTAALAFFGTLSYVVVAFSALIIPVFSFYLLIDFHGVVGRFRDLIPRRWVRPVSSIARQIHRTLGGYVRGQLTANVVLSALYATSLRAVDMRLAVPIGVLTGMLAFVPYLGFMTGLMLALGMAVLDWHGFGRLVGVIAAMGTVQVLDALVITPRIVGRSVGLSPLEVLLTMMVTASLFGFIGVLLAVPIGAVVKILIQRAIGAYVGSSFYNQTPGTGGHSP